MTNNTINNNNMSYQPEPNQFTKTIELAKANVRQEMIDEFSYRFLEDHVQQVLFNAIDFNGYYHCCIEELRAKIKAFRKSLPEGYREDFEEILRGLNSPMSVLLAMTYKAGVKDGNVYWQMLETLENLDSVIFSEDIGIFAELPHDTDLI